MTENAKVASLLKTLFRLESYTAEIAYHMMKSVNLQYNTLGRWVDGPNDSSTKRLMFQVLFFFIISYRLRALKTLYFYFCKVIKRFKKNEIIFAKNFARNCEKK